MRGTFVKTLIEVAQRDPRVMLLTGDLGFMVMEPFAEKFPDRFINMGVAEQNMVGVATGLAEAGLIPFVYSIAPFASLRPYEFIRNGAVHQQLPVRVVAVGGGFEYGHNGASHYGLEDVAVMRTHPGLTVIAPADAPQARTALLETWDHAGPIFYRLGKDDRVVIKELDGRFKLGRTETLREGSRVLLVALGGMAVPTLAAADILVKRGFEPRVVVVPTVNPAPVDELKELLDEAAVAVVAEAHYVNGGLGSLVCEVAAEHSSFVRVIRCGVDRGPDGLTGSQAWMEAAHGLSPEAIANAAETALERYDRESEVPF